MTVLDDRPGQVWPRAATIVDELAVLADRLSLDLMAVAARPAARVLYGEVTAVYGQILAGAPGVTPGQRARVRAAARILTAAGGCADEAADHLGRIASHAVYGVVARRCPETLPVLVTAGNLVLRDLLSAMREAGAHQGTHPRRELVRRLVLGGDVSSGAEHEFAASYDIVVLRLADDVPQQRMAGLLEEYERAGVLVALLDAGVVLLVPASLDYPAERAAERCAAGLGVAVWCATAHRSRERIASGYEEATDVLTLASAAGRRPGVFRLDDFLIEYAVLRQSAVADSLLTIVKPLLANDMLSQTLATLIESDFNRNLAAQALFIHRSTLDYRIRRIEEVTGHNPMSNRGAQVLSAAMTASAVAEVIRRRGLGDPVPMP